MMTSSGHLIFALATVIFAKKMHLSPVLAQGRWVHIILGGMLTSLLPDIDHPKSFLGQRLKWIAVPIRKIFGHRGFTHSLLAIIVCGLLLTLNVSPKGIIPLDCMHAMVVGYMSHIVGDMLTPVGVPLLWPCRWRFRLPLLNSKKNSWQQQIFCALCLIWAILHPLEKQIITRLHVHHFIKSLWQWLHSYLVATFLGM